MGQNNVFIKKIVSKLLNDVGSLLTAVQFQLSLYDGCRPCSHKNISNLDIFKEDKAVLQKMGF